jgi:hypothetical protein
LEEYSLGLFQKCISNTFVTDANAGRYTDYSDGDCLALASQHTFSTVKDQTTLIALRGDDRIRDNTACPEWQKSGIRAEISRARPADRDRPEKLVVDMSILPAACAARRGRSAPRGDAQTHGSFWHGGYDKAEAVEVALREGSGRN